MAHILNEYFLDNLMIMITKKKVSILVINLQIVKPCNDFTGKGTVMDQQGELQKSQSHFYSKN